MEPFQGKGAHGLKERECARSKRAPQDAGPVYRLAEEARKAKEPAHQVLLQGRREPGAEVQAQGLGPPMNRLHGEVSARQACSRHLVEATGRVLEPVGRGTQRLLGPPFSAPEPCRASVTRQARNPRPKEFRLHRTLVLFVRHAGSYS